MKILGFLCFLLISSKLMGQNKLEGIVFDKDTKQRIAEVRVYNQSTRQNTFNNSRGEFEIGVSKGDTLIAVKEGFHSDTLVVDQDKVLLFYLKRSSIYIREVTVVARQSPDEVLERRKKNIVKLLVLLNQVVHLA